jgi:hypothetical protein
MNGLLSDDAAYSRIAGQSLDQTNIPNEVKPIDDEADAYQRIVKTQIDQEETVLQQSLMISVNKNPDQAAQLQKLSEQTGMPVELVQRNVAKIVEQERVKTLKEATRLSPVLARQMSDPKFAALAHDDYEPLSGLEAVITKGRDYVGSAAKGPVQLAGGAVAGVGELYGIATRTIEAGLDQVLPNSAMSYLRTPVPWYANPQQILKRPGKTIESIGNMLGAPAERQGLDTDVIEGITQLGAQIAIFITTGGVGTTITMLGQGANIMANKTEKDDATQAQKDAAIVTGAGITALTERIGLDKILNRVPPQIRNRTLRFIADKGIAGGIEAAQEVAEGLLHDLTRRVFTNESAPILEGAVREGSAAAISAAIVRAALGVRGYNRSKQQEDFINAISDNSKASKLRDRMPEQFQKVIDNMTKEGPVKEVFIPADQFQRYYQSQSIDPAAKAAEFGALNYDEAVIAGTDIVIPMEQFASKLAPTDDLQGLFQDIRLEQDGLTSREFAAYQEEETAREAEIFEAAQRSVGEIQTPELQFIKDEMQQQLISTGYEQRTAEAYATVYAKTMSNLAERAGSTPRALHDKYGLTVSRPLPDVLTRDRRSDAQVDPLLDRLRSGDLPAEKDIYGKSLVDFLIERGGLRKYGELTDVDLGRGPFQRNLVQPETGMDADRAAEQAVEAGYLQGRGFEDVTERDLFDAIDEELSGVNQYSIYQTNEQLQSLNEQLNQIDQYLKEIGIDLSQITDNAEVRRIMDAASRSPELQGVVDQLSQTLFQSAPARAPGDNLMAIHNLSEENIRFTAKMGGLASPSVGVVTDTKGMVEGFGEITLIGSKDLVDPSVEPVFSSDAYTVRYPSPEWRAPSRADADALYDIAVQAEAIIDGGVPQQTDGLTTRNPNGGRLVSLWLNSDPIRALYLQQQGQQVDIIRNLSRSPVNLTDEQVQSLRPLYDVVMQQENRGIRESAEATQLRTELANMIRAIYESRNIRSAAIDSITQQYSANPTLTLGQEYSRIARGPQINKAETGNRIEKQIEPIFEDFRNWVEQTILSRFPDPYITVGRKKMPYTLDNIIKVVTNKKEQRAQEDTATYGTAKTKAASAIKFSDIEQMREAAKTMLVDPIDFADARQETEATLESYREMMSSYPHEYTSSIEIRDSSMRAIAAFSTIKNKTPEAMRQALKKQGFEQVESITNNDIDFAINAAEQLLRTPVPYFEAKPQRIVKFSEFAGAVVPLDTKEDVIKILEDNGIRVEFHEGFDRQEAVQRLANQLAVDQTNILFQSQAQPQLTQETLDKLSEDDLDNLLQEEGVPIANILDRDKMWGQDFVFFAFPEQDNAPTLVTSKEMLDNYAPDLLLAVPTKAMQESLLQNRTVQFNQFATGKPVTFDFAHNTQSATKMFGLPKAGDTFRRDIEPSGRYITNVPDAKKVDTTGSVIAGSITFKNPLVLDATNWKQDLFDVYGVSGRDLSQSLVAAGYDGVVTIEPATGKRPAYTSEILDLTTFDFNRALYQQERGFIQFSKNRKFNISLLENADLSTFLHETGHFYLEVIGDLAQGTDANPQLLSDYAEILKFLGLKSRKELTLDGKKPGTAEYQKAVDAHEKFARAHELYLMEGKAPSEELRPIFQRFKNWLTVIYKDFLRLDVKINDEVRGVFDRIYATDQEIQAAKAEGSFDQLFLDAAAAGMTEAEFDVYKGSVSKATENAKEALQLKLMVELQREQQKWWKEQLANVKEGVAKDFDELQVYKAFKALTDGDIKLNKQDLINIYGKEYLKRLPRGFQRVYSAKDGLPLEVVAREFDFTSGDALIEALIGMPNRKEYINAEAQRIMLERHGDMMTDGTMADEAKLALFNTQREKVLMIELRALRSKQAQVKPFVQAERNKQAAEKTALRQAVKVPPTAVFRQMAAGMIGQTAVKDIQPQRFLNAQRKHGKDAEKALIAGDAQLAADAKQKELLNHFLYLEATKAKERSEKIADYVRKFEKKSTRERIGKAGQVYLEQIDAILNGYEFRQVPNKRIDRRATLQAFVDRNEAKAKDDEVFSIEPINIPASVLEDARQINYRQLSYDELQAVNETVKNIEHVAMLKNKLLRGAEKRTLDEASRNAIETLQENAKGGQAKKLESALPIDRPGRFLKGFMLLHTKFSTMMRQMDGWKDDGVMWNTFVRPLNESADFQAVNRADATKALRDIFKAYRGTSIFEKQHIRTLGQSMTLQGRLMVALNWGRAENRQRLMDGNGLTQPQIDEILGSLDQRDWDVVKNIWSFIDSYWPKIETQYQNLYGVAPTKSEIIPFSTKYGMMPGGYFPIKYDPTKTAQAQAQSADEVLQQMKSGAYMRSQTKNGFTKEVLEKLDRPIKLDLSSLYEHVGEVIHDLALREYLLDTNKLMNHRVDGTTLKQQIIDNYGDQMYREIVGTLRDVAIGDISANSAFEQSMSHLRAGVSIAGMGWNLMTGLMQPLGLTQSFVRVGPKWISKGLMKWGMDAVGLQNSAKYIYEQSAFMRTRNMTQNREINEIRNQIQRQGRFPMARQAWGVLEDSFFQLIIQGQKLVDIPTWLGAHEKALANGADAAKAVALADQAVLDAQGGGTIKDLAAIQRGSPLLKLWTNFYSYFNTTFNLTKEVFGRANFKDPISIGRLAVDVAMLYSVPVVLGVAIREAAKAFITDEEDDEDMIVRLQREHLSYLLGTVVGLREFTTAFDPRFGYSGPAGVRFMADFNRFVTQVSQGDLDTALRKATVSTVGTLLHYPAGQINRIIDGIDALQDGRTKNPAALIFGVPK